MVLKKALFILGVHKIQQCTDRTTIKRYGKVPQLALFLWAMKRIWL